ncbi:MAG: glycosyltransferase family 39 protein [Clostridia bacterium]|nr:glycosyltransferase family 39 protein [Clostridia bacterium]
MTKLHSVLYKYRYLFLAAFCLLGLFPAFFPEWKKALPYPNQLLLLFGLVLAFAAYLLISPGKGDKEGAERALVFLILAAGLVIRFVYAAYTDWNVRQHDVGDTEGHLAYMLYIMKGEAPVESFREGGFFAFHLPDFDVSDGHWQFYHPPLWHFLGAVWMKLLMYLGASFESARESLQVLSLYCSGVILLAAHSLFRRFNLRGGGLYLACMLVAFHPAFIILSGSINNDVLSLALMLVSLVLAIDWYRKPSFGRIIALAFSIGGAMMAKLSAGTVAFAVAFLFLMRLVHAAKKGRVAAQFGVFGAVCVPAALWWQLRNYISFGVNPLYVPGLSEKSSQYVGFRSTAERLFGLSSLFDFGVYPARATKYLSATYGFTYYEYCIPMAALKTSLFGEYYIGASDPAMAFVAAVLFACAVCVSLAAVVCAVYYAVCALRLHKTRGFCAKHGFAAAELAAILIFVGTQVVSYVMFCFRFPHFCTMDYRYIALLAVTAALFFGLGFDRLRKSQKPRAKYISYALVAVAVLFSLSALAIYGGVK